MFDAVVKEVGALAGKFIADKDKQAAFEHELGLLAHKERQADKEINKEEAKHASIFVSGWRPSLGWACSIIMAYHLVVRDLLILYTETHPPELSGVDLDVVLTVLGILLGANIASRTVEKVRGVARSTLGAKS